MFTKDDCHKLLPILRDVVICLREFEHSDGGTFASDMAVQIEEHSNELEKALNQDRPLADTLEIVGAVDRHVNHVIRECSSFKNIGLDIFLGKKQKIILSYIILGNKYRNSCKISNTEKK